MFEVHIMFMGTLYKRYLKKRSGMIHNINKGIATTAYDNLIKKLSSYGLNYTKN